MQNEQNINNKQNAPTFRLKITFRTCLHQKGQHGLALESSLVLGFDDNGAPTLRIEHRGLPAGPTAADMAADAALFIGAVCALSKNLNLADAPPFAKTRDNFYAAARDGLRADLHWFNGKVINAAELITKNILPLAKKGLQTLGAEEDEINTIAEVILRRAESGQNGAQWQKDFIAAVWRRLYRNGKNDPRLLAKPAGRQTG